MGLLKCQAKVDLRRYGRPFGKSIWRHNSVGDHRVWTKFGRLMQNHMPTAVKRSIWKPEVEFQNGDRLLLGSGSSNISAKLHKTEKRSRFATVRPGRYMAAISENLHNIISRSLTNLIRIKFGTSVQNHMSMTIEISKSKPEVAFPFGVRLFSKNGSSISAIWIEIEKQQI